MGCTSSTANMPESQSSTTGDTENNRTCEILGEATKENEIIYSSGKELEQKQVLPESEITENIIASNDNIKSSGNNLKMEIKDVQDITPTPNHDTDNIMKSSQLNDNFVSLKVVVEKVISDKVDEEEHVNNTIETRTEDLARQIEEITMEPNVSGGAGLEMIENKAKESPSPTQSQDSRATRWEALADIAAELPPSLAVDPLTGQIYSLTK